MNQANNEERLRAAICDYSNNADISKLIAIAKDLNNAEGEGHYTALLLMKMLESADPNVQSLLGDCYYQGTDVRKDLDKAVSMFRAAASRGSGRADYDLAWYYYDTKDYLRAIEHFQKCIAPESRLDDANVGRSHRCMANAYANMPNADMQQAVKHWKIAADKYHDSFASKKLGMWFSESGTDHCDANICQHYLNIAAEKGDTEAVHRLAQLYMFGDETLGIKVDGVRAEQILRPFSSGEDVDLLIDLAILYRRGEGVTQDYSLSKMYFEKAWGIYRSPWLASQLGYVYFLLNDYANARNKLEYADNGGDYYFSDFLGRMYREALGGPADLYRAKQYYEHAYRNDSMSNFFTFSEYADLLVELGDYQEAYTVSAKGVEVHNDIHFYFIMAKLVLTYRIRNQMEYAEAIDVLDECIERDFHAQEANWILAEYCNHTHRYQRAIRHYTKAFEAGNADAAVEIGRIYEKGDGSVGLDPSIAYEWYVKAANAGSNIGRAEVACFAKGFLGKVKRIRQV